ncbi:MAG: glycosyltransferase family 2 protein [Muribaculaceae bacterium]|nr:glycosyltransferase family 2 protein [Muribaculaceae bacterium]
MPATLPVIALVVPCYNESAVLPLSIPVLLGVLDRMHTEGLCAADSFILCSDDGSTDNTWAVIESLHQSDPRVEGILLAHNRGQQAAMLAALTDLTPRCDAAITVDADLQDDPEAIVEMVRKFREGYDIVYGVRASRSTDTWFKRTSAKAFYNLQQALGVDTVYNHSEFRLMSRRALGMLKDYDESNLFLRGIFSHIGLPHTIVTYDRNPRIAGETKYSVAKLISVSIDGITSFTAKPMRIIFLIGLFLLLADIVVAVWVLVSHFQGRAISGWSSIMLSLWFLGSLVLIALGIIGEYVGKIFVEVKRRPRFAIQSRIGGEESAHCSYF